MWQKIYVGKCNGFDVFLFIKTNHFLYNEYYIFYNRKGSCTNLMKLDLGKIKWFSHML